MDEQVRVQALAELLPKEIESLERAGDEKPFIIEQRQANNSQYVTMPDKFE